MERNNISDVWLEAQIDENGIALSLISEGVGEDAIVEAVDHYTFEELQDKSGDMFNMNLSDDSRETLSEMRRLSNIGKIAESDIEAKDETESQEGKELPEEGDILWDDNAPSWSQDDRVEVVNVTDQQADEYVIEERVFGNDHVSDANPSYDEQDTVIEATYLDSERSGTYAFPASRLEKPEGTTCTPTWNDSS
jgi:hypothetical protein